MEGVVRARKRLDLLSADNHIVELPDLWTRSAKPKLRDRMPRLRKDGGFDNWVVEDGQRVGSLGNNTRTGERWDSKRPHEIPVDDRWESVRPGGYDPHEAIKDMELDGVQGAVLFPTLGVGGLWRVKDPELLSAICAIYNDWIAQFCQAYPQRLKGVAMINLDSVQEGIEELRRAKKLGLIGAVITVYPPHEHQYHNAEYMPFWQEAEDLGMALCLHSGSQRTGRPMSSHVETDTNEPLAVVHSNGDHWIRRSLTSMILAGVFDRFPRLRVVGVENEAAWAAYWMYKADLLYRDRGHFWPRSKSGMKPSEFFHRNVALSFQEDWVAVKLRSVIGVENLLWGSDYPHQEGTWPYSQKFVPELFKDVSQEELRKITYLNTANLFGFIRVPA